MDKFPHQSGLRAGGEIVDVSAVRILIFRRHAQAFGGLVHPLDKGLIAAGDVLRHDNAAGAGRGNQDQLKQGVYRHGGPGGQGNRGGIAFPVPGFLSVFIADGYHSIQRQVAGLQLFKDDVSRHDLGHGGWDPHGIGILFVKNFTGIIVDHDGACSGDRGDVRLLRSHGGSGKEYGQRQQQPHDTGETMFFTKVHMRHLLFRRQRGRTILPNERMAHLAFFVKRRSDWRQTVTLRFRFIAEKGWKCFAKYGMIKNNGPAAGSDAAAIEPGADS